MGPEGFVAYEHVDDGAFAEPWLALRPWASVKLWEYGLQTCLGSKALHTEKKKVGGECSTAMILRGLHVCTESEIISLPEEKLKRAQEFLPPPCFDPGVTRIDLEVLQELRGKAEHWGMRNSSLAPEMHAIDKLLCSYRGMSRPRGAVNILKQAHYEFWDTLEVFRINMSNPEWWGASYRSSFNGVLTLPERLSFNTERDRAVWFGSGATMTRCAAVDHTNKIFTVFEVSPYSDFLSELTGLPRGDYEIIAIDEFLSSIAFLIIRAADLDACVICYAGDNQNLVTWIRERRPGNRVAKYFVRILNRLESENNFTVSPMYITTLRNKLQGELCRLDNDDAAKHGAALGLTFVDVGPTVRGYFNRRMGDFALVLPTDNDERVRTIMQYVEKRIVRHLPMQIPNRAKICAFGVGANRWDTVTTHAKLQGLTWETIPWPSERMANSPYLSTQTPSPCGYGLTSACVGAIPHSELDRVHMKEWLQTTNPLITVFDCRPLSVSWVRNLAWLKHNRRVWSWAIETSSYEGTQ